MPKKSLLKKNQSKNKMSAQKIQFGAAASTQKKMWGGNSQNQLFLDLSQMKNNQMSRGNMLQVEESEPESAIPDENDLVSQPNNLNFYSDMEQSNNIGFPNGKMNINELEQLFGDLHGPDYFIKDDFQSEKFTNVSNTTLKQIKQKELAGVTKLLNSHDFKYSMIPFSDYNNSVDVNMYTPKSKIPFLYKDEVPQTPSIRLPEP